MIRPWFLLEEAVHFTPRCLEICEAQLAGELCAGTGDALVFARVDGKNGVRKPRSHGGTGEAAMHHGEFATLDWFLLALVPPMLGSGIGLLLGMARGRPGRAAAAGMVGGAVGAWAGVLVYCLAILPNVHDPLIFTACVFAGFLLGAIPLSSMLGASPDSARAVKPVSGPLGGILGGVLGLLLGVAFVYLNIVPGQGAGLEYIGYYVCPMMGAIFGVIFGLIVLHWTSEQGRTNGRS
jgi:hypothetical protein